MFYHMDFCKIVLILKIRIFADLPSLYYQTIFYSIIFKCLAASELENPLIPSRTHFLFPVFFRFSLNNLGKEIGVYLEG